jgi:hypothetical protein
MFYIFDKKIGIMKNYLKVIENIICSKNVTSLNVYNGSNKSWNYYSTVSGYYN